MKMMNKSNNHCGLFEIFAIFTVSLELFKEKLIERLSTADIKQVKEDVLPFMRNPKELDIWSNDYFVQLAGMVRIE